MLCFPLTAFWASRAPRLWFHHRQNLLVPSYSLLHLLAPVSLVIFPVFLFYFGSQVLYIQRPLYHGVRKFGAPNVNPYWELWDGY